MIRLVIFFLGVITWTLTTVSCNNTKYLPANESLYTGARINIEDGEIGGKKKKALRDELEALTRPIPNKTILGLRVKLWLWNIADTPKRKISVNRWLRKIGEAPVLLSDLDLERNNLVLQNYLENKGYFQAAVTGEINIKKRRAEAVYQTLPRQRYTINEVVFPKDSSALLSQVSRVGRRSLLKKGEPFDLELIKTERIRIDDRLKERGFYFFNPDYLLVDVDSTIGNSQVNMYVHVKQETPQQARRVYRINDIVIYPTYSINTAGADTSRKFGIMSDGYFVVDSSKYFKPKLFRQAMQFNTGDIYRRREHNATLNRLINLGIFKFVRNRFEITGDTLLNAYYYLTPQPKKSLRVEVGGTTKSNNLAGSQLTVGFTNRNTFRAGEILTVNATGGMEVQVSGQYRGFNTYTLGAEANLAIPRFVIPFVYVNPRGGFVPRTNVQLGYDILNRQKLFTLNSFTGQFGYSWKESREKEHTFYPVSVQYVQPIKISPLYRDRLLSDPTLQKIIDTQFILGANYNYQFNQVRRGNLQNAFYFNGLLDVSGNIAGLIRKSVIKSGDTARLFGAPFSQFLKVETDLRYYRRLGSDWNSAWANRIVIGAGFPYGNSRELPFIKQFFVGGNNSLRAFRSRSLGPGTYIPPNSGTRNFIPDQSGDLKLEINSELRFKIFKPVYGALFVDAGNIWLLNDNPAKPGAQFSNEFLKEVAVGTGLGVRVDVNILVVRLDLAFPLRKPWLDDGERWVIDAVDLGNSDWRKQNLIFNIAIGYPF